jgi:phosphoribosyl 1,2-cyclic phosphodiesterase
MKFIFPGTKGEIEEENLKHKYHSSLIVEHMDTKILIDLGEKYSEKLNPILNNFDALLITHAHPDHYIWTKKAKDDINIPVYLTEVTLNYSIYKPLSYTIIEPNKEFKIKNLVIIPYKVIHSLRCPTVCFKIRGDKAVIYAPDILDTEEPKENIFLGVETLIADGSSFDINLVRKRGNKLFGHAMIKTEIGWCKKFNIPNLYITHCGKQIIESNEKEMETKIYKVTGDQVNFKIAFDGFKVEV